MTATKKLIKTCQICHFHITLIGAFGDLLPQMDVTVYMTSKPIVGITWFACKFIAANPNTIS